MLGFVRVLGFTRQNVGIRVWWQCFVFFHHALIKLRVSILDTMSIPFTSKSHRCRRSWSHVKLGFGAGLCNSTSPNWYSHPLCPSVQFHVLKTGRRIKLGFGGLRVCALLVSWKRRRWSREEPQAQETGEEGRERERERASEGGEGADESSDGGTGWD